MQSILEEYNRIEKANKDGIYDFDCFICIKQSELNSKQDTDDFKWLKRIKLFERMNNDYEINTFLADVVLKDSKLAKKGSNEYNAFIQYALQKAKVLLLVCSKSEYAQTKWVKNEYTRFMECHKNPQIVLVGDNPKVDIAGITDRFQVYPKDNIDDIIACVKSKTEEAKSYVDSECYYCKKCGKEYPRNYSFCPQIVDGIECGGHLLPAMEYANYINVNKQKELQRKEKELREKDEEIARLKSSLEEIGARESGITHEQIERLKKLLDEKDKRIIELCRALELVSANMTSGTSYKTESKTVSDLISQNGLLTEQNNRYHDQLTELQAEIARLKEQQDKQQAAAERAKQKDEEKAKTDVKNKGINGDSAATYGTPQTVYPTLQNYRRYDFAIRGTVLKKYRGIAQIVQIPYGVTVIWESAFRDCKNIMRIEIPRTVTSIESSAFYNCGDLTSIEIPNSVYSIAEGAFGFCDRLASITVESGNTAYNSVGNCLIETRSKKLIAGCKNSVIPTDGSVTSIGDNAFACLDTLTHINVPKTVTNIGKQAFASCRCLTSVVIPKSVDSIGDMAFKDCSSLTSIKFDGTKAAWSRINKGIEWNSGTAYYRVTCTDGVLTKQES